MPKQRRLDPAQPWVELTTTPADWKAADPALLATMLGQLHLIRAFEETVLELAGIKHPGTVWKGKKVYEPKGASR